MRRLSIEVFSSLSSRRRSLNLLDLLILNFSLHQPKIAAHAARCSCSSLCCVDCSREFDKWSVGQHVSCVTEHDKYAKGATKPGGAAANGFFVGAASAPAAAASAPAASNKGEAIEGAEHLSKRFPWKCHLCGVGCTSEETLLGHAQGLKHRRRARAAAKNKGGKEEEGEGEKDEEKDAAAAAAAPAATASPSTPPQKGAVSEKKDKKEKRKQEDDVEGSSGSNKKQKEPKWKKLALTVLSSTESKKKGGMKVSKLLDAVLKAAGIESDEKKKEAALAAWGESCKLRVEGGRVLLA